MPDGIPSDHVHIDPSANNAPIDKLYIRQTTTSNGGHTWKVAKKEGFWQNLMHTIREKLSGGKVKYAALSEVLDAHTFSVTEQGEMVVTKKAPNPSIPLEKLLKSTSFQTIISGKLAIEHQTALRAFIDKRVGELSRNIYKESLPLKDIKAKIDETADTLERVITHLPKASQTMLQQQIRGWNDWVKAINSDPSLQTDPEQAFKLEIASLARLASDAHDRITNMKLSEFPPDNIDNAIQEVETKITELRERAGDDPAKHREIDIAIISWRLDYPLPQP
jgi:hypothetical protein